MIFEYKSSSGATYCILSGIVRTRITTRITKTKFGDRPIMEFVVNYEHFFSFERNEIVKRDVRCFIYGSKRQFPMVFKNQLVLLFGREVMRGQTLVIQVQFLLNEKYLSQEKKFIIADDKLAKKPMKVYGNSKKIDLSKKEIKKAAFPKFGSWSKADNPQDDEDFFD